MTKKQKRRRNQIIFAAFCYLIYILIDVDFFLQFLLALAIYIYIGKDVLKRALSNIKRKQIFDENFLMTIATIGAFGCGEFSEAIAVMLFYQIGELFESIAVGKSRQSIQELLELKVEEVYVLDGSDFVVKEIEDIVIGDIVLVKAGQKIGVDGIVLEGQGYVDMAALTGESLPVFVDVNQEVLSGSISVDGALQIQVSKLYEDSTVAKILEMVENAVEKKAKAENFITKFARYYTPSVVFLALALVVIPSLFVGDFLVWLQRACVFLVVSCPCALVISVPLTFFGGIGKASRNGILVKGSNYLEALANVELVSFDKTGTLTKGEFVVKEVVSKAMSQENVLAYMALLEKNSNHPISKAIITANTNELNEVISTNHHEIAGKGIYALVDNQEVLVGNANLMLEKDIDYPKVEVGTVVYLAINKECMGYVLLEDEIKDSAISFVSYLNKSKIDTLILTGDNDQVANKVQQTLGVKQVKANLLPADKVVEIEKCFMNKNKGSIVFIGDGMNDAPVLSRVDIGISMGQIGSDVAIEASDIVIMDDDLLKVQKAIEIAKRTMSIVHQNIIFALSVKISILILSTFGIVGMWAAVFGDVGVSIIAIINARRV